MSTLRPFTARVRRRRSFRPGAGRARALVVVVALTTSVVPTLLPAAAHAAPPAPQVPSSSSANDVGEGSSGPRVAEVQAALIKAGVYLPGGADGVWGRATTKGIADFQTWNGLTRTGALDATTLRRLGLSSSETASAPSDVASASAPAVPAPVASSASSATLALGSRGPAVVELQQALLATGLVIRGGADGVFGLATQRALKAFQRVNGLKETGAMSAGAARALKLSGAPTQAAPAQPAPQQPAAVAPRSGSVNLKRFPVQGHCGFGDTWHQSRGNGRLHEGVDILAPTGNLLYAVDDGVITTQYWDYPGRRSGNGLKLTTADGTYYVYLHLSGFAPGIAKGSRVKAGDVLGFVGSTGSSATPHLHFEIHPGGGAPVNPYPYVKAINDCSNTEARYQ